MEEKEVDELYRGRQERGGQEIEITMSMRGEGKKMDNCMPMEGKEEKREKELGNMRELEGEELDEWCRGRQEREGQEMWSTMSIKEEGEKMEGKEEEERGKRAKEKEGLGRKGNG